MDEEEEQHGQGFIMTADSAPPAQQAAAAAQAAQAAAVPTREMAAAAGGRKGTSRLSYSSASTAFSSRKSSSDSNTVRYDESQDAYIVSKHLQLFNSMHRHRGMQAIEESSTALELNDNFNMDGTMGTPVEAGNMVSSKPKIRKLSAVSFASSTEYNANDDDEVEQEEDDEFERVDRAQFQTEQENRRLSEILISSSSSSPSVSPYSSSSSGSCNTSPKLQHRKIGRKNSNTSSAARGEKEGRDRTRDRKRLRNHKSHLHESLAAAQNHATSAGRLGSSSRRGSSAVTVAPAAFAPLSPKQQPQYHGQSRRRLLEPLVFNDNESSETDAQQDNVPKYIPACYGGELVPNPAYVFVDDVSSQNLKFRRPQRASPPSLFSSSSSKRPDSLWASTAARGSSGRNFQNPTFCYNTDNECPNHSFSSRPLSWDPQSSGSWEASYPNCDSDNVSPNGFHRHSLSHSSYNTESNHHHHDHHLHKRRRRQDSDLPQIRNLSRSPAPTSTPRDHPHRHTPSATSTAELLSSTTLQTPPADGKASQSQLQHIQSSIETPNRSSKPRALSTPGPGADDFFSPHQSLNMASSSSNHVTDSIQELYRRQLGDDCQVYDMVVVPNTNTFTVSFNRLNPSGGVTSTPPPSLKSLAVPIRDAPPKGLHGVGLLEVLANDPRPTFILGTVSSTTEEGSRQSSTTIHELQLEVIYHNDAFSSILPDAAFSTTDIEPGYHRTTFNITDPNYHRWISSSFSNTRMQDGKCRPYVCPGGILWTQTAFPGTDGSRMVLICGVPLPSSTSKQVNVRKGAVCPPHMWERAREEADKKDRDSLKSDDGERAARMDSMEATEAKIPMDNLDIPSIGVMGQVNDVSNAAGSTNVAQELDSSMVISPAATTPAPEAPTPQSDEARRAEAMDVTEDGVALIRQSSRVSTIYSPHLPSDYGFFDWSRLPSAIASDPHTELVREVDWSLTGFGAIETWPQSLRTMINLVLSSPHPAAMYWGSDFSAVYNEPYIPLIGSKHPRLLGQPYKEAFEKTRRVIAERRMLTLREVGERCGSARDVKSFWRHVLEALETNPWDAPFAVLYSCKRNDATDSEVSSAYASSFSNTRVYSLEGTIGVPDGHPAAPPTIDLKSNAEGFAVAFKEALLIEGNIFLSQESGTLPADLMEGIDVQGFSDDMCTAAVVCPINPSSETPLGFLVLGVNPRRPFDDDYRLFIQLLTRQLTTSVASVVLYEEEIRRAQRAARLAALDKVELSHQLAIKSKEAEHSELKFTRMAEFAPVGIFIADFQGNINYHNDMFTEISGHPRDVDVSRWLESVHPADAARTEANWLEVISGKVAKTWEFRWKTPLLLPNHMGEQVDRWTLLSASPEVDADGVLLGVFGSITNISETKFAEDLQKRRVEEVVELKRQQDNFVDMASHEMRNPLSAILQGTDAVLSSLERYRDLASSDDLLEDIESSIDVAQTISLCALHQKRVVDDILTMSKLDSALLAVTPVDVQPVSVVDKAFKMFEQEAISSDTKMVFNIDESYKAMNVDWVKLDPARLLQVLINLLTNALKFLRTEASRTIIVTLGASLDRPSPRDNKNSTVYFSSTRKPTDLTAGSDWGDGEPIFLTFSVLDTGKGLTLIEKKNLFQKFSQATAKTEVSYGGSGLGLFICKELVHLQAGEIGVQSEAGKGCVFSFYIKTRRSVRPEVEVPQAPVLRSSSSARGRGMGSSSPSILSPVLEHGGFGTIRGSSVTQPVRRLEKQKLDYKVLIVEDNLVNQKLLRRALESAGCTTYVANHGAEALEKIKKSEYWKDAGADARELTVVLMDVEMPVMDGLTCSKRIRQLQSEGLILGHIPIIAVTANARQAQIDKMFEAGMDDVVSKPYRITELIPKLDAVVMKYKDTPAALLSSLDNE
ncbi:hypothetical protein ABW19_dt0201566 [Dactylella cylindrospora]|nr:hypothetical protein ABW19_dt0201566 [Dactylella cylindrospora]